ncbi:MAG: hypothetical protein HY332_18350 [Chloroflexi bacterium]|nr:hypothetical protein [Chloroflexota bacterium]
MGVLDDPALFYAEPQSDWSLGDIVVVPTVILWADGEKRAAAHPQPPSLVLVGGSAVYEAWSSPAAGLPLPLIECRLSPAVIAVDDCVIDKDFNAYVDRRIAEGTSEALAVEEARARPDLDPLIPVCPLLPYSELRFAREAAVRQAQPIGYFPILGSETVDEGYLDFTRTVPVSRQLLVRPLAALSEAARQILRWKFAQFSALRNLSVDAQIMAAVGRTITDVKVVADNRNRLVVELELDGGPDHLTLRQEPRREAIPPGHTRGRPSA